MVDNTPCKEIRGLLDEEEGSVCEGVGEGEEVEGSHSTMDCSNKSRDLEAARKDRVQAEEADNKGEQFEITQLETFLWIVQTVQHPYGWI